MSEIATLQRANGVPVRLVAGDLDGAVVLTVYDGRQRRDEIAAYFGLSDFDRESTAAFARAILEHVDPDALAKPTPAQTLAKHVVIDPRAGTLTIDGTPFPYYLAEEGPTATSLHGALTVLTVPILVESSVSIASSPAPAPVERFTIGYPLTHGRAFCIVDATTDRAYPFTRGIVDPEKKLADFRANPSTSTHAYASSHRSEYGV
jgi:hypothetical protein